VRRGRVNESALAAVERRLPAIRGLAFTAPVPALAQGPEEIRATVAREIDESYPPVDLERVEAVYERLGLLPAGTSLRAVLQRLYEQEGAGFYDPRTKRLVLATRALRTGGPILNLIATLTGRDLPGEFVAAHELTHALQDQHYGLPTEPEPLLDAHGDRLMARRALLEGDANLAGFAYLLGGEPDAGTLQAIERELAALPAELDARYPDVPRALRSALAFQYQTGTSFAAWALAAGGWPAVDRAEASPPDSTEQVLHPARYFATRERPVAIALRGTEELEARGWTGVLEDTLGELQVRILAAGRLPGPQAARVADGWGGDRLRALARGRDLLLVWMTAWDAPEEAMEFAAALPALLPGALVERRDERVLVLLGPADGGGPDPGPVARCVWAASSVSRPPPGEREQKSALRAVTAAIPMVAGRQVQVLCPLSGRARPGPT
jgi:hypothetical protein